MKTKPNTTIADKPAELGLAPETQAINALKAIFKECALIHRYWGDAYNEKEASAARAAGEAAIAAYEKKEKETAPGKISKRQQLALDRFEEAILTTPKKAAAQILRRIVADYLA